MKNAIEEKKVELTAGETAFIDRFVVRYCRPHAVVMAERLRSFAAARQMALLEAGGREGFALAAGPVTSGTDAVKAPDEPVTFVFASDGEPDAAQAWRAELAVPPGATAETPVPLVVEGGGLAGGVFSISGCALPLENGSAEIPFGLFLAGIRNTDVALRRADGESVAGRLLFF